MLATSRAGAFLHEKGKQMQTTLETIARQRQPIGYTPDFEDVTPEELETMFAAINAEIHTDIDAMNAVESARQAETLPNINDNDLPW
jgi:hypothetical protein